MFTLHGFSYWAVLGAADLETRYATILVVLATAVMIYYAFFTTISHRYRFIPHWSSLFPTRKPPQTPHRTPEPLPEKDAAVDVFPYTWSENLVLTDEPESTAGFEVFADPIVEPQTSLVESAPQEVADCLPSSQPFSGLAAHPESETNVEGPERRDAEESLVPEPSQTDDIVADFPLATHPEIKPDASSPDTEEAEPRVIEIQGMVCAASGHASGDSDVQTGIESVESLVTVSTSSPLAPTLEPADVEASLLMETPFLLSVDNGSSEDGEASLGAERLTEDNPDATSPSATVALAGSAFVECPCSRPDSLHEGVSSDIMHSALLVPAKRVVDEGESSEAAGGLEIDDDDWTSVDPDEPSTPRPSSPAGPQSKIAESTSTTWTGENDLAVSAVLLTQSQYAPVILTPNTVDDSNLSSPTSSPSPRCVHPRVHTEARPDWAVAPREDQEDIDATRERTLRRHSVDSPDQCWHRPPFVTRQSGVKSTTINGQVYD